MSGTSAAAPVTVRARRPRAGTRGALAAFVGMRLALGVFVLRGTVTLVFLALHLLPGHPVDVIYGGENTVSEAQRAQITADFGLDKSIGVQYLSFVGNYVRADLGTSYLQRRPVADIIGAELLPTLQLTLVASALAVTVALLLAVGTAGRRSGWVHRLATGFELLSVSTPTFWSGILLLSVFSFHWHVFDVIGGKGVWNALALPAIALALGLVGTLSQVLRESLEKVLDAPFILSSRARGMGEGAVRWHHALRHALLPALTVLGWFAGGILGGAVVTESVFGRPGIGRVTVQAIVNKDIPVVIGVALLSAAVFVVVNLIVDLLYPLIDPRLRER